MALLRQSEAITDTRWQYLENINHWLNHLMSNMVLGDASASKNIIIIGIYLHCVNSSKTTQEQKQKFALLTMAAARTTMYRWESVFSCYIRLAYDWSSPCGPPSKRGQRLLIKGQILRQNLSWVWNIFGKKRRNSPPPFPLSGLKYIWRVKIQFPRFPSPLSSYWLLTMAGAEVGKHSGNQVD